MMWIVGQRVIAELEPELGLGVVLEIVSNRFVEVSFPRVDVTRRYSKDSAPLRRLQLQKGQKFRAKDGKQHIVGEIKEVKGLTVYVSEHGIEVWEYDLSDVAEDDSPITAFLSGSWAPSRAFQLRTEAWKIRSKSLEPEVRGLIGARVTLLPHQLGIANAITKRDAPRVLLADEVGLGKTIEAGLIFSSLRALGRADKVLVLVPEALEHQWLFEIYRRFHEMFSVIDEERSEEELSSQAQSAFQMNQRMICSIPFFERNAERLQEALEEEWDLIIVDEAHRLAWSEDEPSIQWEIVRLFSQNAKALCLLTATPQRQGLETLFGLLHLVDPARFHDFSSFKNAYSKMEHVADLARKIDGEERSDKLTSEMKKAFPTDEDLRLTLQKYIAGGNKEELLNALVDRHGTGRVLFRNRRKRIKGFPERKLVRHALELPKEITKKDLLLVKAKHLLSILQDNKNEKVLLICSSQSLVLSLQEWFRQETQIKTAVFHEDMEIIERDRQAAWFAEADGARILLCSEIGSEGRNFQFCHHLVLFDLPMHPDVLEQRIGRLDRIGQKHVIQIHVPYYVATTEEVLVDWYEKGLEVFSRPWNGADLGETIINDLEKTLGAFDFHSKKTKEGPKLLKTLLEDTRVLADRLRKEQEEGVDVLIDINSFNQGKGITLCEKLHKIDTDPSLSEFMGSAFDFFGVEWEELDDRGKIKITKHSLSFVESFPGLNNVDELLCTFNREQALTQEELTFLTEEHPIVQGALSLVLEGTVGRGSAGLYRGVKSNAPMIFEFLFVLQAMAPSYLEIESDLKLETFSIFLDPEGEVVSPPANLDQKESENIKQQVGVELAKHFRDLLPKLSQKAAEIAQKKAKPLIEEAQLNWLGRLNEEIKRLTHLSKVNPLISYEEIEFAEEKRDAGFGAIKTCSPRLDAIRLLVFQ